MLHLWNEILERRIRHVADEQIAGAVLGRQEMIIRIRSFRCHPLIFVVSGAASRDSWFQVPHGGFVVSGAIFRVFGYQGSLYQVPKFVVSGAGRQKSIKAGRGLQGFVHAVTLLNTDSNLINTNPSENGFERKGRKRAWP